ncbi:sodium/hydrogen exchanger 9B2-like [Neocloeon triangulifer]|uniref:sodium/hydrogen exchanger 9B2-like n=1 Tax=Neocloeon triangulifer TaxID=2078957 RepID=UPI00286ED21D|nr:sodium/hydrogen exchanger 9B2-like [Neocloeon triangulifer]
MPKTKRNRSFLPSRQIVSRLTALWVLGITFWCSILLLLGEDALPPNGQLWQLILLALVAKAGGWISVQIRLPGLLGMLLAGMALQSAGVVTIEGKYSDLIKIIRKVSLVIIMMRAGLDLDPKSVKNLKYSILTLGWIPWAIEMCCVASMSWWLLNLSWPWALMLGAIEAAVSPAVVVPNLISLRERGFGVAKGVPTLVFAVTGIEDAISISAFGVISSLIFTSGSLIFSIIQGPLSVCAGILTGGLIGLILKFVPDKDDPYAISIRVFMLLLNGLVVILGFDYLNLSGAGPLAIIVAAFGAGTAFVGQGMPVGQNQVALTFRVLWQFFEPIVFGLVGAQIKVAELPIETVGLAAACVVAPLLIRFLATLVLLTGSSFNAKEKIFVALAWMAKATVQAVLGPAAIDLVKDTEDESLSEAAKIVFIVCVTSILLTAPLGAVLIATTGPRLLKKASSSNLERKRAVRRASSAETTSFLRIENKISVSPELI